MSEDREIEKREKPDGFAASLELPEGHQLIIGELPPGTIVEVATWQGTGRPNESTNRFLLSASGSGLQKRGRKTSAESQGEIAPPQTPHEIEPVTAAALSIGSIGAAGSRVTVNRTEVTPSDTAPVKKKELRSLFRALFTVVSVIAISSIALSLAGFGLVVPDRGAKTALGPSKDALVIYKKSPSVEIGNPTVARIQVNGSDSYIFGPSNSFDGQSIQIETTSGQELVPAKDISGRAFLAIPFIGKLFKPLLR